MKNTLRFPSSMIIALIAVIWFSITVNDGYQHILVYNTQDGNDNNNNKVAEIKLDTPDKNDWVLAVSAETPDVNISSFTENSFIIRFDASGQNSDTWKNRNMSVKLRFKK